MAAELGPRKERQAQVDGGEIQCVGGLLQLDPERFVCIERGRLFDQDVGEVGENPPVATFVGLGQRAAGHFAAQSQMVELRAARTQAGFDVAQTFAAGELREGQAEKLIPAGEAADFVVTTVTGDTALKLLGMNPVEQLGQDEFVGVHGRKIAVALPATDLPDSNRSHCWTGVWPT